MRRLEKIWRQLTNSPRNVAIVAIVFVGVAGTAAGFAATTTYSSLAAAYNNIGTTSNSSPSTGNFDNNGGTYSYQDLTALGWKPGTAVTYAGAKLTWPNIAAGKKNNVVAAGQNITFSGKGVALTFLAAADHGPSTGTGKITYTDGSTSSFTITAPDWLTGNQAQNIILAPHRNYPSGQKATAQVFPLNIPLNPAKTIAKVTLPSGISKGRMHIFSMAVRPVATGWSASWGTSTEAAMTVNPVWKNQTLRMTVKSSIGGSKVRVRFENTFNKVPVTISHATVAVQKSGSAPTTTPVTLTFGGSKSVTMPAGGDIASDAATLTVPANAKLLISEYFAGSVPGAPYHVVGLETNFNTLAGAGDHTADTTNYPTSNTFKFTTFLAGVDVGSSAGSVVAFGDSITDGVGTADDSDARWTNDFSVRLGGRLGVYNAGIAGNMVLTDQLGQGNGISALSRMYRDVIAIPGAKTIVLLEGTNDLSYGKSALEVENGIKQIVTMAHQYGLKIYISPLTPAKNYSSAAQIERQSLNTWIMSGASGADGTVDFNAAVTDGNDPEDFQPAYDSGDHLHPSPAGYQAMADSLDLTKF